MKPFTYLIIGAGMLISCSTPSSEISEEVEQVIATPTNRVFLSSEIEWEKLNPARGDQSPQAGTIWGDRKGEVATGFLAKFVDGFSSPPHIHNVSYRAVVIEGNIHNDDPEAENMWMEPGSFWTQPAGEAHITSANGPVNIAYVEIDSGPYLVKPTGEAYDNGERPVNIAARNVVWLESPESKWLKENSKAKLSFLWENTAENYKGLFVKIPTDFSGTIESDGSDFRAIVIQGEIDYSMPKTGKTYLLDPGSSFTSENKANHAIANKGDSDVILYVKTNGSIKL